MRDVRKSSLFVVLFVLACVSADMVGATQAKRETGWQTYQNARFGFSIAYPTWLFQPAEEARSDAGQVFNSIDGRARLLVGALENGDGLDLRAYRDFVKSETYAGGRFDYEPIGRGWFVLSGRRGDQHFYQWVGFGCAGRLINSWAMTYPDSERNRYDPIVEVVAKTYKTASSGQSRCP